MHVMRKYNAKPQRFSSFIAFQIGRFLRQLTAKLDRSLEWFILRRQQPVVLSVVRAIAQLTRMPGHHDPGIGESESGHSVVFNG